MDALQSFFEQLKKKDLAQGHFLGFLNVLIGRTITTADGASVSTGLGWRELASWLKKTRWEPDDVRELGIEPDELPPRDRQRYWYTAISRAQVHSAAATAAGERFATVLSKAGYQVGSSPKSM